MAYQKGMVQNLINKYQYNTFTHQDAGIHYATLNALVRRGWLTKTGAKYQITDKGKIFAGIENYAQGHEFFCLRRKGEELGMMCNIGGGDLFDAWGAPYDVRDGVWFSVHKPNAVEVWIG